MAAIGGRTRLLALGTLVVAFAVGVVTQRVVTDDDPPDPASPLEIEPDLDLRLLPTLGPDWTIRTHDVVPWPEELVGQIGTSAYGAGTADRPFADGDLMVVIDRTSPGQRGDSTSPEPVRVRGVDGFVRRDEAVTATTVFWNDPSGFAVSVSSSSRSVDEIVAAAEALDVDEPAPLGTTYDGLALLEADIPLINLFWSVQATSPAGETIFITAGEPRGWLQTAFRFGPAARPTEVRGVAGLDHTLDGQRWLIWREAGLVFTLNGPAEVDLAAIATGLRPVDEDEWTDLE